jgi:hypothetical protein
MEEIKIFLANYIPSLYTRPTCNKRLWSKVEEKVVILFEIRGYHGKKSVLT